MERDIGWRLTVIYKWANGNNKYHTMGFLKILLEEPHSAWLYIGELNLLSSSPEKQRANDPDFGQTVEFQENIEVCELREVVYRGDPFTGDNGRENEEFIQERLDMACSNDPMMNRYPRRMLYHLERCNLDHKPILLSLDSSEHARSTLKSKPFRFKVM